ncbi:MAG: zinc-dependent dehydrogenase [Thermoplasmata archaeon]|nr:zinc-dependent dehydrogenase [Thermoplasmata archaeon]
MRVAMYYSNDDIRTEEMPMPQIGPGELLIKIEASGICGSDVMEWYRRSRAPLVLGHEIAGEIVDVGKGVRYNIGERVTASHHVPCNTCYYCLNGHHTVCDTLRTTNFDPGGFAEYVRLPSINVDRGVYPIPDNVSLEEATFTEPLACVIRGQRKANIKPGQTILVLGSGIAGLLHIQLARALGAGLIIATDIVDYRLKAAKKFGAKHAINARENVSEFIKDVNDGRLADLVIVCTGATSAIEQALKSVDRAGTILFFAPTKEDVTIPFSINETFWRKDVILTTSYAGAPVDHHIALKLIKEKRVNVKEMITHRLPLSETGKGFKLVAEAKESIKVIIEPQK